MKTALPKIRLVVSDMDGTLLNPQQLVTARALSAIKELRKRDILFTVGSSRPGPGIAKFASELGLTSPVFAFNGGAVLDGSQNLISQTLFAPALIRELLEFMQKEELPAWALCNDKWYAQDFNGSHIARGSRIYNRAPLPWNELDTETLRISKVVGVSDDPQLIARCEKRMHELLGSRLSISRSQSYYLDITPAGADKGNGVLTIATLLGIPLANVMTLGDMPVDVPMFRLSGYSIAMGNASDEVKEFASFVAGPNTDEGFAKVIEELLL